MFKLNLRRGRSESRIVSIEPELAKNFHAGDIESFSTIYSRFKIPLFSFLVRRTDSACVAEDLSHDIFLKVLKSRKLYDPTQAFAPWFWTVSRNTLNDYLRRRLTVSETVPIEGPEADEQGIAAMISTADIETLVIKNSDRTVLLKFMDQLTQLQRDVLSLRLVQKLSYSEISKKMNLSLSAVKSLIHRAQGTLKGAFRKENRRQLGRVARLEWVEGAE